MNDWYFLGFCAPTYVDSEGNTTNKLDVALFSAKEGNGRKMVPLGKHKLARFENHPFYNLVLKPWAAGDGNLYRCCHIPSEDLKERLKKQGWVWNEDNKSWREQKFEAESAPGSNIIQLKPKK